MLACNRDCQHPVVHPLDMNLISLLSEQLKQSPPRLNYLSFKRILTNHNSQRLPFQNISCYVRDGKDMRAMQRAGMTTERRKR